MQKFLTGFHESLSEGVSKFSGHLESSGVRYKNLNTGETCRVVTPVLEDTQLWDVWAPQRYEEIRALQNDVQVIAKNTGFLNLKLNE